MTKLDKDRIKNIAINRFHDKQYKSVYDCWTEALEVWLSENNLMILSKDDIKSAIKDAKKHQDLSKILD